MNMNDRVVYQIYPFGFCGAPRENDGICVSRIKKVINWIAHMKKLGVNTLYFCPLMESDSHGYDTRDYTKLDTRLGTNADFAEVCDALHENGIDVILDGVFNHVGRNFPMFQDVIAHRQESAYKDWFYIDWNGQSNYGDGFWYEGWEGHFELVKLRLENEQVQQHLLNAISFWVEAFGINGLRLDVAYMLPEWFLERLREHCAQFGEDFHLIGEIIHGDYRRLVAPNRLHSATNYECFKGIYSSLDNLNMFEIGYSLKRQFGPEDWTVYKGLPLLSFLDNHDVNRVASNIRDKELLPLAYAFIFTMPGFPNIYYGSEWGAEGVRGEQSDEALRPCFPAPEENELCEQIAALAKARAASEALRCGDYRELLCTNAALIFQRCSEHERAVVIINGGEEPVSFAYEGEGTSLLTGEAVLGEIVCPPKQTEIVVYS